MGALSPFQWYFIKPNVYPLAFRLSDLLTACTVCVGLRREFFNGLKALSSVLFSARENVNGCSSSHFYFLFCLSASLSLTLCLPLMVTRINNRLSLVVHTICISREWLFEPARDIISCQLHASKFVLLHSTTYNFRSFENEMVVLKIHYMPKRDP